MARLLHHMSFVAPAIFSLLMLLGLAALAPGPAAATAAEDTPVKTKVRMRIRHADKEEAQWLNRYAETHQPLGAGPLRMVRATPEKEHWLNRLSNDVATTEDGDDGAGGSGYIDFDDDNPYAHALRDWVSRLTKQISMEGAAQAENPFQDL